MDVISVSMCDLGRKGLGLVTLGSEQKRGKELLVMQADFGLVSC